MRGLRAAAAAVAVVLGLGACSTSAGSEPTSSSAGQVTLKGCDKGVLRTVQSGALTIAVEDPAYAPWFIDNDPSNGQGYEGGVGYHVAQLLGYDPSDVRWVRRPFPDAVRPGAKSYDLALMEAAITPQRQTTVDFSDPYYGVRQAVVTWSGSPIANASRVANLRTARLGAVTDSTSYAAIGAQIRPTTAATAFASMREASAALARHEIEGIVADQPTAAYLSTAALDDGKVLGELPAQGDEQLGAVLAKGSALTPCVSAALARMRADGTLTRLADQWMTPRKTPLPRLS
ncbi:ABC transporter substrate-binding protein [Luteipulveratus flavus]|uniref:Transporter substrate-binding domain-containing protein n=1 Tax=Luteipulveratus flavus TaxID=3031728 RepID=A0ABT6C9U6_9MICO|nr:transporter substrate-binding domain-containing protein [Luteipulveratus sp. YIM 133296]MDF8265670.1 transporter substrate-binding domain-containing protein [Luteipulveratus sp. YIM 133296]